MAYASTTSVRPPIDKLADLHLQELAEDSAIHSSVIEERGYRTVWGKNDPLLLEAGFSTQQRRGFGWMAPIFPVVGSRALWVYKPQSPRQNEKGRPIKYEWPAGQSPVLDCHPRMRPYLADPSRRLWVTEGIKKADALVSQGEVAVALLGVYSWRGTNEFGGKTALADWEVVTLNDREVFLAFDSDVRDNLHVQEALERLAAFLSRKGARVFIVDIPSRPDSAKQGVDDFLATGGTVEQLIVRASDAPSFADGLAKRLGQKRMSRLDKEKLARDIREDMSLVGRFVRTPADEVFYFRNGRLIPIERLDPAWRSLLSTEYRLNGSESLFHWVSEDIFTHAYRYGQPVTPYRLAHWDAQTKVLYVTDFADGLFRLDGQEIRHLPNGSDGVLFRDVSLAEPVKPEFGRQGLLAEYLLSLPNLIPSYLTPEEQRAMLRCWLQAIFLPEENPTRPIAALVGPKGSGKSIFGKGLLRLIYGPRLTVSTPTTEEAFDVLVSNLPLVALDNVDGHIPWLNDRLAVVSTGYAVHKRELYTTNKLGWFMSEAAVVVTSRDPHFRRDDVADRLLVLRTQRLSWFMDEASLLRQIDVHRNAMWGEILSDLNHIVAQLRLDDTVPASLIRLADFGRFGAIAARAKGPEAETQWWHIMERLQQEQDTFTLEDDPFVEALMHWLDNAANRDRLVSAGTLHQELNEIAQREKLSFDRAYRSPQGLAKRIAHIREALEQRISVKMEEDAHTKTRRYAFVPRDG